MNKNDTNGSYILYSLLSFLWYTNVIEPFFEIRFIIPILGACMILFIAMDINGNYQTIIRKIPLSFKMQLVFYILMLPCGILNAINPFQHITNWFNIIEYLLIMTVIIYYSLTRGSMQPLLWNISAISVVLSIILIARPIDLGGNLGRYSITKNTNPNGLAVFLSIGIWSILFLLSNNRLFKPLGLTALGIIVYAILLTGSRKGLIGSIIMMCGWFFFSFFIVNKKQHMNRMASLISMSIALVAFVLILLPYYNNSSLSSRMETISSEVSTGTRSRLIEMGLEDFKNNILFGYGFGGFELLHGVYSHSTIIEVLVSCGLLMSSFYFLSYLVLGIELLQKQSALLHNHMDNRRYDETFNTVRMGIVLFIVVCFYSTCIIHIYEISSMIIFGLLFSSDSYITIEEVSSMQEEKQQTTFSKYIR